MVIKTIKGLDIQTELKGMKKSMIGLLIMLDLNDIPYEINKYDLLGTTCFQICSPTVADKKVDAVSTPYTYGGKEGLMEVMGSVNPNMPNDDVVGWLDAAHAFLYFVD